MKNFRSSAIRNFTISAISLTLILTGVISSPAKAAGVVNKACSGGGTFEIEDSAVTGSHDDCVGVVVIPEGVTEIWEEAFAYGEAPGITSVTIPASVTEIYELAFAESDIAAINVASGNANYKSIDGVLFNKSGTTLLLYPSAKAGAYTTPVAATTIGAGAFKGTSAITSLTFSASIVTIANDAFYGSSLTEINVVATNPTFKSVDGILFSKNGQTLIKFVGSGTTYTIPANVLSIGESAFGGAISLTSVTIPDNVTTISRWAFEGAASLASVTIETGSRLTSIGDGALRDTALTTIEIPASVTSIGDGALSIRTLTSVSFEDTSKLASIGPSAFSGTALASVEIPTSVTSIGERAFERVASLTSVTFEAGSKLTTIGYSAFELTGLSSITIPASVTTISERAFSAVLLTSVTFESGSKLTSIGSRAFDQGWLVEVTIPASVTSIGDFAFGSQAFLTTVSFESGSKLTTIGTGAFSQAYALTSIAIPASVTTIRAYTFSNNTALTTLTFEAGSELTTIEAGAFRETKKLSAVSIPASVSVIGNLAFYRATSLASVTFEPGSGLTSIGSNAFRETAITEITIPRGVISVLPFAFSFSSSLSSISFLGNAPTIGDGAFFQSPNLTTAYVSSCATGFTSDGSGKWNGLAVSVVPSSNPCIVVYNLNGGTGVTSGPLSLEGKVDVAPTPPTRTGYTFVGWSETNGGDIVTFPYGQSGAADLTLFAKWVGKRNIVTYDSDGGTPVADGSFISGGQITEAPTPPTLAGYTFRGWYDPAIGELIAFPYTPTVVTDITLYALWRYNQTPNPNPSTSSTPTPTTKPSNAGNTTQKVTTSYVPKFQAGSASLTKSGKTTIKKLVKKSGVEATYTITGVASKSFGVPNRFVKALAKLRAEAVKAYLVKLGVKKSKIKIKVKITTSNVIPKTKIKVEK